MTPADERYPLEWIDEYVARLRNFIFVREEDCLLIKVPNEAHKLNPSGVRILQRLLDGDGILDVWQSYGKSPQVQRDLYEFFVGLKQVLQGCLNEHRLPEAVDSCPFSIDFNTLPVLSELALTYRCNLRCRFCYTGRSSAKPGPDDKEMSTDEAREILRIIREDAQCPSVSFTGGEPTLRRDLVELVRFAREELGLRVNLITNGTLVDAALAERLADAGLNSAQVSLEAPEERIHEELTGVKGCFQKTLDAIHHLRASNIIVHTNTTLTRLNADAAPDMPALVHSLGLERFSMNLVIPVGASVDHDVKLRYSEIPDLIDRIQAEAERHGVEFMWYSPTPVCIFNPIQHRLGNKGCAACDGLLSVSPSGDVLPCSSWPEPVGNLFEQGFRSVWESSRPQWIRGKRYAPPLCRTCEDFALCQSACPLYWQYFGYDELNRYGERYVAANG